MEKEIEEELWRDIVVEASSWEEWDGHQLQEVYDPLGGTAFSWSDSGAEMLKMTSSRMSSDVLEVPWSDWQA